MVIIGHFYFVDFSLARLTLLATFAKPPALKLRSYFRDGREASLLVNKANGLSRNWGSGMGDSFVLPLS